MKATGGGTQHPGRGVGSKNVAGTELADKVYHKTTEHDRGQTAYPSYDYLPLHICWAQAYGEIFRFSRGFVIIHECGLMPIKMRKNASKVATIVTSKTGSASLLPLSSLLFASFHAGIISPMPHRASNTCVVIFFLGPTMTTTAFSPTSHEEEGRRDAFFCHHWLVTEHGANTASLPRYHWNNYFRKKGLCWTQKYWTKLNRLLSIIYIC